MNAPIATPRRLPLLRSLCPEQRPCPYVSCRYHLLLTVSGAGKIRVNNLAPRPSGRPWTWTEAQVDAALQALEHTCLFDAIEANQDGMSLNRIGTLIGGLSRERARQIELEATERLAILRQGDR